MATKKRGVTSTLKVELHEDVETINPFYGKREIVINYERKIHNEFMKDVEIFKSHIFFTLTLNRENHTWLKFDANRFEWEYIDNNEFRTLFCLSGMVFEVSIYPKYIENKKRRGGIETTIEYATMSIWKNTADYEGGYDGDEVYDITKEIFVK